MTVLSNQSPKLLTVIINNTMYNRCNYNQFRDQIACFTNYKPKAPPTDPTGSHSMIYRSMARPVIKIDSVIILHKTLTLSEIILLSLRKLKKRLSQDSKFDHLRSVSTDEIRKIITAYNSCELDPIPTWLLKLCVGELLPLLTSIINNSFESGVFSTKLKQALIRPLLKKHNLDPEELKNYGPVSNLHFISKIIEKIVAQQLEEHISIHSLHDPIQSAYKSSH